MNRDEKLVQSPKKEISDFIEEVYEILNYAGKDDVFHYIEEATEDAPKRIITIDKNGRKKYLIMEEKVQERIQKIRDTLDKFEELFRG